MSGTTTMTLQECATRMSLKENAAFADIDKYAADAGEGLIPQQVIIWQKSLFVLMCLVRQYIKEIFEGKE